MLRQGGSGTTTARWLGRKGARVGLVGSVGRDAAGRALVRTIEADGVTSHVVRIGGHRTGRIGVFVGPDGERSFVQDRAAATQLAPSHLRGSWFASAELVHIPTYSLLGHPLGDAGLRAAELGHAVGALVTVDLASSRPLLALGRETALAIVAATRPDLVFAAGDEADPLVERAEGLLALAPVVVIKRGAAGVTVLFLENGAERRLDVATSEVAAAETTGAGDAFDAGFILGWLRARHAGKPLTDGLRLAATAGNRLAAKHLIEPKRELDFD